jgi:hypothetical protein
MGGWNCVKLAAVRGQRRSGRPGSAEVARPNRLARHKQENAASICHLIIHTAGPCGAAPADRCRTVRVLRRRDKTTRSGAQNRGLFAWRRPEITVAAGIGTGTGRRGCRGSRGPSTRDRAGVVTALPCLPVAVTSTVGRADKLANRRLFPKSGVSKISSSRVGDLGLNGDRPRGRAETVRRRQRGGSVQ